MEARYEQIYQENQELKQLVKSLELCVEQMGFTIKELEASNQQLKAKVAMLSKNSSNSSKPPSTDIVTPPKTAKSGKGTSKKRKIGAQKGHKARFRKISSAEAQQHIQLDTHACPRCLHSQLSERPEQNKEHFQYELVAQAVQLSHYIQKAYYCTHCHKNCYAPLPPELQLGMFGPHLSAFIAFLKGRCHASYSVMQVLCVDVLGVEIALGTLVKIIKRVSKALQPSYEEVLAALQSQPRLNIDESSFKENGKRSWTWVFCAPLFSVFKLSFSRSVAVLEEVLGKGFCGVIGSDCYAVYHKFGKENPAVKIQCCHAHLVRELFYLKETGPAGGVRYANYLLGLLEEMFTLYHNRFRLGKRYYREKMQRLKREFLRFSRNSRALGIKNFVKRFKKVGESYFCFLEEDIEPTNNLAERTIRYTVIDRRVSQGVRAEAGRHWCERIWSVQASCQAQGRSVFGFLCEALYAMINGTAGPSLLPSST